MKTIAFEINEEKMNQLKIETGIKSTKDLINYALSLYEWALINKQNGFLIGALNEEKDAFKELNF